MIRFSAALVVVAVGVLIGGIATSLLALVYVAIGLSAAALIALAIGVAFKRDELFGVTGQPVRDVMGAAAGQPAPTGRQSGYPPVGPERVGQTLAGQPGSGTLGGNVTVHGTTGGQPPGSASGPASPAWGTGAPARGPVPSGSPAESAPAAPPTRAPAGASQAGVTETRADLKAIGVDTPQTTGKKPASDPAETRLDARAEAGKAAPGKAGSGSEETRFDLPPVRPADKPADSAASSLGRPGVADTRMDMSPVLADESALPLARSEGTRTPAPPAGADDTRLDLPAQPSAPAQPEVSAQPPTPTAQPPTPAAEPVASAEPASPAGAAPEGKAAPGDSQVAVIPGVPRYHTPNCILIRFMDDEDLEKMTMDQAKAAGFTPCTACQVDTGSFKAAD